MRKLRSEEQEQEAIKTIETFVVDRCDAPSELKLGSLRRLTLKDLEWLVAAVENC